MESRTPTSWTPTTMTRTPRVFGQDRAAEKVVPVPGQRIRRHWLERRRRLWLGQHPKDLDAFYARYQGLTDALLDNRHVCGYCYTQLTNVEQEQNGLYTYDRKPKFDMERLRKIQSRPAAYETDPPLN